MNEKKMKWKKKKKKAKKQQISLLLAWSVGCV